MRAGLLVTAGFLMVASSAMAQGAFPPGAEVREAQLMQRIGPQTRAWIAQESAREAQLQELTVGVALDAVRAKAPALGKLNVGDIDELVFIVMMEAAKDAEEDVKTMVEEVEQVNKSKAILARLQPGSRAIGAAPAGPTLVTPRPMPRRLAPPQPIQPRPLPRAEFDSRLASLLNDKDGLEDMSETEQLRLQMVMDRRSRAMETLSNLMKKMSDNSAAIIQNLP